uniref:Uncharacterized protein n=1 Tax=Cacopsylla melanoneura TaxID=428564 RepID=A0A8D8VIJ4_9HEMI
MRNVNLFLERTKSILQWRLPSSPLKLLFYSILLSKPPLVHPLLNHARYPACLVLGFPLHNRHCSVLSKKNLKVKLRKSQGRHLATLPNAQCVVWRFHREI